MTTAHNHPPRCCCGEYPEVQPSSITICPLCPEHGELRRLRAGEPQCPGCHQLEGRPHTDYCPAHPAMPPHDRTSTPATHTSQPVTQYRTPGYDGVEGTDWPRTPQQWHETGPDEAHERWRCSRDTCGIAPLPRPNTGTPGQCTGCHRDYDQTPGNGCPTPAVHDNPR